MFQYFPISAFHHNDYATNNDDSLFPAGQQQSLMTSGRARPVKPTCFPVSSCVARRVWWSRQRVITILRVVNCVFTVACYDVGGGGCVGDFGLWRLALAGWVWLYSGGQVAWSWSCFPVFIHVCKFNIHCT